MCFAEFFGLSCPLASPAHDFLRSGLGVKLKFDLKEQGRVTVNKPIISSIYIVAYSWPSCSAQIMVDGVNPD